MESLKRKRSTLRSLFSRALNNLKLLVDSEEKNFDEISKAKNWLDQKASELFACDKELENYIFSMEDESSILAEVEQLESYKYRYFEMISLFNTKPNETEIKPKETQDTKVMAVTRRYILPKIELKQFDGELKNWLGFWGQFHKIDEDLNLDEDDKFQYLLQATVPGTSARRLVESFPPSGANYKKAISMLKSRFARDELLIEMHIRELLKLVLREEIIDGRLRTLYDRLMTQIHALDTLNVTKEKYASMLYPMVESTLPVDTLRAWERYRRANSTDTNPLSGLLIFLEKEVDSEERIELAKMGFENQEPTTSQIPTAACIIAGNKNKEKVEKEIKPCIWCKKLSHTSSECIKARDMTLEERKNALKSKRACFKCLKEGHSYIKCKSFVKCIVCNKNHHAILCPDLAQKEEKKETTMSCYKNNVTLLPTLLVNITGAKKTATIRALVDSGSQRSYIMKDVASQLGLNEVGKERFGNFLFGGAETKPIEHTVYDIKIRGVTTSNSLSMQVVDQNKICGYIPRLQGSNEVTAILEKNNIELTDRGEENLEVGLLIGSDYVPALMTGKFINLSENLVAVKTTLGWTIQGKTSGLFKPSDSFAACFSSDPNINKLWELETIGINDPIEVKHQREKELDAMESFESTVTINKENRYEVNLLWREGRPELDSNYKKALSRLHSTTQRLLLTGNYNEYNNAFKEWLDLGIVEVVDNTISGHFLPHHAVVRESSSTTRVRPVFDASAKDTNGRSLNGCLDKGLNLIERIPKLMTKFREGSVGVISDIKKAFLQISLCESDRNYLKFLWWRDPDRKELMTFRHCRVVFGITCSPFLLSATLLHHLKGSPCELSDTAGILSQSFYVDNCITSFNSECEARKFMSEANQLMESGKFELRGWVVAPSPSNKEKSASVLGLSWDTQEDILRCNPLKLSSEDMSNITKRKLLSFAHRLFDPIGFTSPVALIPKILLQKACQYKLNWDVAVPRDIEEIFRSWLADIDDLNNCYIPRRLTQNNIDKCCLSLHVFCDASKDAYGACIFLRSCLNDQVSIRLVAAKARVAPCREKKGQGCVVTYSIPRLELLAALIGVRLFKEFASRINVERVYYWSDSSVALTWIQKDSMWGTFVGNRVKEIRATTSPEDWHHVPGHINPADVLSRGCSAKDLQRLRWWEGPGWLRQQPSDWPRSNFTVDKSEVEKELKKTVTSTVAANSVDFVTDNLGYFSKYSKIVRCVAWIFRFVNNCRSVNSHICDTELSTDEYSKAELVLLRTIQASNDDSSTNIHIFLDSDGLKRVRSKLTYSEEVEHFKSPILLPSKNSIVERLVRYKHEKMQHAGTSFLVSALRERYWIVGVRRLVKRVVRSCVICRRFTARSVQPATASLPEDRIKNAKAFEVTGVDMAGPLFLKSGEKCWIALFTCAVYRAVHFELCLSLTTDCFIMALRRFIARRGRPEVIYSDNGTNFRGTANRLSSINWEEVSVFSSLKRIKWHFNVPCAPWWGGWWERLVRVMKELLRRILGKSSVTYDELETLLADCEATINSRPLTYVADDSENLKPLSPILFLQGISNSNTSDLDTIDHTNLNNRLKYLLRLREEFRARFRSEYLSLLIHRGKSKQESLNVGDVVLVEADTKRIQWPLGVVIERFLGKDGQYRVARVKTSDGIKVRPLQRLYPLEVSSDAASLGTSSENDAMPSGTGDQTAPVEIRTRSGRLSKVPRRLII